MEVQENDNTSGYQVLLISLGCNVILIKRPKFSKFQCTPNVKSSTLSRTSLIDDFSNNFGRKPVKTDKENLYFKYLLVVTILLLFLPTDSKKL